MIGKSIEKPDARDKVTGQALYPGDINLPGQAYMKVLFAERPHAIIQDIDISKAVKLPGVIAVLTAKDVPVNEYGLIMNDQPVLCGPGSKKPFAERVRFIGDQVALIIAESESLTEQAKKMINVEYQDLPVISDAREAKNDHGKLVHPDRESNVFCHYQIRKGDLEKGLHEADVIIEGEYITPVQEHAFLQPEAGIAYIDEEDRVTIMVAGQWTHEDQEQIAHSLDLPPDKIRVIYPAIGGAFGGREDMSVQIDLALAAWHLMKMGIHKPVKTIWSREESIIGHHKRHPYFVKTRWGATHEGKITAAEVELVTDGGAYAYTSTKVMGNATLMCTGPYEIPNVKVDSYAVYTNNIPNGAFRGFGGPQGAFVAECQVNKLAEAINMDPVEIRMRNLLREGSLLSVDTPMPKGVTIDKVVHKCAEKAGWKNTDKGWQAPAISKKNTDIIKHGIGFACSYKNVGFSFGAPESCTAKVELHGKDTIEHAILYHSGADVGQGAHTIFIQFMAELLNLPLEKIHLIASDTARTGQSGSASASRITFMAGNSIVGAVNNALKKWINNERPAIAEYEFRPPKTTPFDPQTGKCQPNFSYGYVAQVVDLEVDTQTGKIKLDKVICVDDVGKAVNPLLVRGQIEGATVQAQGYALMENFIQKEGRTYTPTLSTYLIPTILDIPEQINSIILEEADPIGPLGARGMGEMPFLPFTPAVVAAVHAATGIWFDEFPLTPERVISKLHEKG
ncbi:MAG: xanthine dehydrogenase family protein [Anaerolineaceae bacterium]|nr:xanthine dehydrogenase family protein [Anaerolineaceae bacterium]